MKWIIASDLHGSAHYCRQLLEAWKREEAPRMLFLGDLLYHGPRNDLPRDYAPKRVIPLLNALADRIIAVRGNCDAEVDQMVLPFPVLADYCLLESAGHLIYATHGHHFNEDHLPPLHPGDVLLHGHTRRVVAAVFHAGEPLHQDGSGARLTGIADDSAHKCSFIESGRHEAALTHLPVRYCTEGAPSPAAFHEKPVSTAAGSSGNTGCSDRASSAANRTGLNVLSCRARTA